MSGEASMLVSETSVNLGLGTTVAKRAKLAVLSGREVLPFFYMQNKALLETTCMGVDQVQGGKKSADDWLRNTHTHTLVGKKKLYISIKDFNINFINSIYK